METQDPPKQITQTCHMIPADSTVHCFSKVHGGHISQSELLWGIARETCLKKVTYKTSSGNFSSAMNSLLLCSKMCPFFSLRENKQTKKGISLTIFTIQNIVILSLEQDKVLT